MLVLESIHHRYGKTEVLRDINLVVESGEIVCLLGASGSGKSTLLRVVAGLETLQAGCISFNGEVLAEPGREPPPETRRFGMVFQDHVLFPHMKIGENVSFGIADLTAGERGKRVAEQLEAVGLGALADRYPHTLSGGQQQRVALARALAPKPRLMLLDEPFASVDSTLRRQLREDARLALKAAGVPAIVVTHDAQEAMELADRVVVIGDHEVVQIGTPEEVWRQPANRFVAELFGDTEAITGTVSGDKIETAFGSMTVPRNEGTTITSGACDVIVRPGSAHIEPSEKAGAVVEDVRFLGDHYLVILQAGSERLRVKLATKPDLEIGGRVAVTFDSQGVLVYFRDSN